jgi:hypothetical protein
MPDPKTFALARQLAQTLVNEIPWTGSVKCDSTDIISEVAAALDPLHLAKQEALLEEVRQHLPDDLGMRLVDFMGAAMAYSEDGGYLFGLAVGQLVRIPALAPDAEVQPLEGGPK